MTQDLVSVLMPAFKPEFLREAMSSVLNQTHGELELLIGDNSGDPAIAAIIAELDDPRVIHVPSHAVTNRSVKINHRLLWLRARGRYVRFVYDDDVIYPRSSEVLLELLKSQPGSSMAWHQRDLIDSKSRILARQDYLDGAARVVMDEPLLLANLARKMNFIGEFCFLMFDRQVHPEFNFHRFDGFDIYAMWDTPMYVEAARNGPIVGTSEFLGGFRRHESQLSFVGGTVYGCCIDWEFLFRHGLANGKLGFEDAQRALQHVALLYAKYADDAPGLAHMGQRLVRDLESGRLAEGLAEFDAAYRALPPMGQR